MNLTMSIIGALHSVACLYAIAIGALVLWTDKGGATHRRRGRRYTIATLAANLSALGIYTTRGFGVFHWMALITLGLILVAFAAARWKRPRGVWLRVHLTAVALSYYMLWGGAVNEVFLRVTVLRDLPGSGSIAVVHTLFMAVALMAIAYFWGKTSRPIARGTVGAAVAVNQT